MTKADIVKNISDKTGMDKSDVQMIAEKLMDEVKHQFKQNKHLGTDGDPRRVHLVAHFVFAARTEQDALLFESPGSSSAARTGSAGNFPSFTGDGDDLEAFADWFVCVCQDKQLKIETSRRMWNS